MKQSTLLLISIKLSALVLQEAGARFTESIYLTHNLIEKAVLSDPKLIFKLREAFHPVVPERRWQIDGIHIVPIRLSVSFNPSHEANVCGTNVTVDPDTVYCQDFRWTNSYLLNLISPELLLTMDPAVYLIIYSEIVRSTQSRSNLVELTDISINSSCVPSLDDFLAASAIFISWSQLYATETMERERPVSWDSKYQGYTAKWYTYFRTVSYFHDLRKHEKQPLFTQLGLWITFAFLNTLIPVVFVKRGGKVLQVLALTRNKNVLQRIIVTISIFNILYFIAMVVSHIRNQSDTIRKCYTNQHVSSETEQATFCHDILGAVIAKVTILPTALLMELTSAIYHAKKMKRRHASCATFGHALALWQLFVFVQITVGLISIPLVIMTLITPAQSTLVTGAVCTPFLLIAFILVVTPCSVSCKETLSKSSHWVTLLENLLIAGLVTFTYLTYYFIVSNGAAMGSIKGYVLSLVPTIPISMIMWVIKQRFTRKAANDKVRERKLKSKRRQRQMSLSTEEEMIYITDTADSADDASDC